MAVEIVFSVFLRLLICIVRRNVTGDNIYAFLICLQTESQHSVEDRRAMDMFK